MKARRSNMRGGAGGGMGRALKAANAKSMSKPSLGRGQETLPVEPPPSPTNYKRRMSRMAGGGKVRGAGMCKKGVRPAKNY